MASEMIPAGGGFGFQNLPNLWPPMWPPMWPPTWPAEEPRAIAKTFNTVAQQQVGWVVTELAPPEPTVLYTDQLSDQGIRPTPPDPMSLPDQRIALAQWQAQQVQGSAS